MKNPNQLCFEFYHQAKEKIVKKVLVIKKRLEQFVLKLVVNNDMPVVEQLSLDFSGRISRLNEVYQDAISKQFIVETEANGRKEFSSKSRASLYLLATQNGFVWG